MTLFPLGTNALRSLGDRDCLAHDDRVEGPSGLLSMFIERLGVPQEETEKAQEALREQQAKELGQEIGDFRGDIEVEVTLKGKLRGNW